MQFVYLYGEIAQKLGGAVDGFMKLSGRPRNFAEADGRELRGLSPNPPCELPASILAAVRRI